MEYREPFRLVSFPSWDLFSWKHKLEVKEVLLSEDIPGSTGLCTLSCFRERELASAGTAISPSLTSIIIGFQRLGGVPRYLISFLSPQYILRNLLCSMIFKACNDCFQSCLGCKAGHFARIRYQVVNFELSFRHRLVRKYNMLPSIQTLQFKIAITFVC